MSSRSLKSKLGYIVLLGVLLSGQPVFAGDDIHKLVIQVSTDDVRTQNIAMNNAVNLHKALGQDNIIVKGVGMVAAGVSRIMELQEQGYAYVRP